MNYYKISPLNMTSMLYSIFRTISIFNFENNCTSLIETSEALTSMYRIILEIECYSKLITHPISSYIGLYYWMSPNIFHLFYHIGLQNTTKNHPCQSVIEKECSLISVGHVQDTFFSLIILYNKGKFLILHK